MRHIPFIAGLESTLPAPSAKAAAQKPGRSIVIEIIDGPLGFRGDLAERVSQILEQIPTIDHHHVIQEQIDAGVCTWHVGDAEA